MSELWPSKDPTEIKDYDLDWTGELAGDTILTSTWTLPPGVSLTTGNPSFLSSPSSSFTKVWLSGGTSGQTYKIKNVVTTALGRTEEAIVTIYVRRK